MGWSAACLDVMEQEHQDLVQSVATKPALHAALSSCNNNILLDASWSIVKGRFDSLKRFVEGIASIFLGISQVEIECSIINIEKDNFRSYLTELLLKVILHSKQYAMLVLL